MPSGSSFVWPQFITNLRAFHERCCASAERPRQPLPASLMATSQSYKLLADGEPAEEDDPTEFGRFRRRYLEPVQSIRGFLTHLKERQRIFFWIFILSAMFAAFLIALVVKDAFAIQPDQEDVLRYIDPLVGTGMG